MSSTHRHSAELMALKPGLRIHDDAAFNAEPAPHLLDSHPTAEASFFVRNNGTLPETDELTPSSWRLVVDGEVERPLSLSIDDLRTGFDIVHVVAVLECAGNGRSGIEPPTDGLQWGVGAAGCARWTGVRLRDLLRAAGVKATAVYTGHESPDRSLSNPGVPAISRGLPIAKAMAEETLVAFGMNGGPLPYLHGFPLRIVAPGFPGSAWQKWLNRIWVRDREHDGARMTGTDYRLPNRTYVPGEPLRHDDFEVITDLPVRSMITSPADGFHHGQVSALTVAGFAWAGHTPVAKVEVSADGGASWIDAALETQNEPFAWRRFTATVTGLADGPVVLTARATDAAGRAQPLDQAPWNPRGYCNNAVHRVHGTIGR